MLRDSATHCSLSSKFKTPATLRLPSRTNVCGRIALRCYAFEPNPYEALERAVQVINRIIDVGEKAQGKGRQRRASIPRPERWVQFGAASSSRLDLLQTLSVNNSSSLLTPTNVAELLQAYLALPVEEYALLDPKWIRREDDSGEDLSESGKDFTKRSSSSSMSDSSTPSFRLSVPLQEVIGVDLRPELSITAVPDLEQGCVTMVGSRAALGSPGLDKSFKLELVAVLSSSEHQSRGKMPPLPGRPVDRLRKWAARRRARAAAAAAAASAAAAQVAEFETEDEDIGGDELTSIDFASMDALIPGETIYVSGSGGDNESSDDEAFASGSISENSVAVAASNAVVSKEDGPSMHCRVDITMAIKVPGALRVVPNPLLGYAGSLVLRAVLNGALPNFLNLLSADFGRWVEGGKKKEREDAAGGDLFSFSQTKAAHRKEEDEEEGVKEGAGGA